MDGGLPAETTAHFRCRQDRARQQDGRRRMALLLWSTTRPPSGEVAGARRWLLARKGKTDLRRPKRKKVVGHDPRLVGWPWVEATHSWLEPTALAILALCRLGLAGHPRVKAGVELILDRALDSGGWNYGNKSVFGTELRPQPGPTGLALLALAAGRSGRRRSAHGLTYLRRRSSSLPRAGIAGLGHPRGCVLTRHPRREADRWLAQACRRCTISPTPSWGWRCVFWLQRDGDCAYLISRSAANSDPPPDAACADKTT